MEPFGSEGARRSGDFVSPFGLLFSTRLDSLERGTWIFGRTRRGLSPFEHAFGSSAVSSLPSTASSPSRAVCMRELNFLPVDLSPSCCMTSSSASDCEAEFRGSWPALLAMSGCFKSPMKPISTSSPWEGCVRCRGRRPVGPDRLERSGDDDGARRGRYSGDGEGFKFTIRASSGGVRFKPSSSEP